jgi:hypothetical protein
MSMEIISAATLLFLIELKMVSQVKRSAHASEEIDGEPMRVPLATSMVAPGEFYTGQ